MKRYIHDTIAKDLKKKMAPVEAVQLVHNIRRERHEQGIDVVPAGKWLAGLSA